MQWACAPLSWRECPGNPQLIGRGPLNVIDHQGLHLSFCRLQFQPQLIRNIRGGNFNWFNFRRPRALR